MPMPDMLVLCRLIKAGALHKRHAARVTLVSAWAEVLGYACSVVSKSLQLQDVLERERLLSRELAQHCVSTLSMSLLMDRCIKRHASSVLRWVSVRPSCLISL